MSFSRVLIFSFMIGTSFKSFCMVLIEFCILAISFGTSSSFDMLLISIFSLSSTDMFAMASLIGWGLFGTVFFAAISSLLLFAFLCLGLLGLLGNDLLLVFMSYIVHGCQFFQRGSSGGSSVVVRC